GRSPNILRAAEAARAAGIYVIGMTGDRESTFGDACDLCIRVPSSDTPRIQEGHLLIGHTICALVEEAIFGQSGAR
ncbi:MAG: phosphoheptose isomerase, partial [Thiomonas sp.]|nr:phosphoheptose isomerase [Thiomonas sp.]